MGKKEVQREKQKANKENRKTEMKNSDENQKEIINTINKILESLNKKEKITILSKVGIFFRDFAIPIASIVVAAIFALNANRISQEGQPLRVNTSFNFSRNEEKEEKNEWVFDLNANIEIERGKMQVAYFAYFTESNKISSYEIEKADFENGKYNFTLAANYEKVANPKSQIIDFFLIFVDDQDDLHFEYGIIPPMYITSLLIKVVSDEKYVEKETENEFFKLSNEDLVGKAGATKKLNEFNYKHGGNLDMPDVEEIKEKISVLRDEISQGLFYEEN
ncbi:hypothetical protein M2139_000318 [Enterococcus sp. PF1-24]|uniref:hypothetical protein n=1 Tax=unclassified Enterococcus TaxID=2608891 RepID=UPI00247717C8|nr:MULTISPECIES: hypothetical protein [unclassified Enterococcus]MDH6363262.1 hypothetical protein [Enterococcus sp. PFB1-1]MDH6400437.1 hypothetical protein [Enterococcus sp. PF1-24]